MFPRTKSLESPNAMLVSKTSAPEAVVDYAKAYYLNAPRPVGGQFAGRRKVGRRRDTDRGLGTGTEPTLSTILTAVTSIFTAVLSKVPAFGILAPPPEATTATDQFELTVQKDLYQHTHARYVSFAKPCPIELVTSNYALTITAVTQAPASKDDPNTVKVSGTITLPKSQPSTSTPAPPQKDRDFGGNEVPVRHDEIVEQIGKLTETTAELKSQLAKPKSNLDGFKEYAGVISLLLSLATGFFALYSSFVAEPKNRRPRRKQNCMTRSPRLSRWTRNT